MELRNRVGCYLEGRDCMRRCCKLDIRLGCRGCCRICKQLMFVACCRQLDRGLIERKRGILASQQHSQLDVGVRFLGRLLFLLMIDRNVNSIVQANSYYMLCNNTYRHSRSLWLPLRLIAQLDREYSMDHCMRMSMVLEFHFQMHLQRRLKPRPK